MPGPMRGNHGLPMAKMTAEKKHVLRRIIRELVSQYKWRLLLVALCIVVASVTNACTSIMLKNIIDQCIDPTLKGAITFAQGMEKLGKYILIFIGIFSLGIIVVFVYSRSMATVTQGYLNSVRKRMFGKMQQLPIKYFDVNTHGDIMSHFTNDTDTMRQLIGSSLVQIITSFVTITALFAIMLVYSVWLTLVLVMGVFVMIFMTRKLGGASAKYFVRQQRSLGAVEGFVEEMMHGQKVVKVFCHEREALRDFDKLNNELQQDAQKANGYANILGPINNNIGHILYVLLAFAGAIIIMIAMNMGTVIDPASNNLTITGMKVLTPGIIVSFLTMSRSFCMNINEFSQQINYIVMGLAGAERIYSLMDEQPETDQGTVTMVNAVLDGDQVKETNQRTGMYAWKKPVEGGYEYIPVRGDIVMENVDFGYDANKIVLHDMNLYAKPGQKLAFVGATGAGKTTITNLINRFYDITDGKIFYDGIDIKEIRKADLRRSLGIVLQDTNLFTGTVMENIRYGKLDASDEECIEAAKLASADDFIMRLPDGYNTLLTGDGANLSQGQRQLLSIARAAVSGAPVMIMDEATSSIDTRTEALVQQGTDRLMHGRTVFVIAHRLSTVQNSDVIMVLDHGRIIERGSHDELIARRGQYYRLYTGAFELE